MILVEAAPQTPSVLDPDGTDVLFALNRLAEHHLSPNKYPGPLVEPEPELYAHPDVLAALNLAFCGKCGYCETPLASLRAANVDHYRPTHDAIGADGSVDHSAYWWLSYAWPNLVLSCLDCAKAKGRRFPVVSGRLHYGQPEATEQPLLLDPRAEGGVRFEGGTGGGEPPPDAALLFAADGTVSSADKRGRVTIDVLALNRTRLVDARRDVAKQVAQQHGRARASSADLTQQELAPELSYLGLRRQLWAQLTKDASLTAATIAPAARAATKLRFESRQQARLTNSLADDLGSVGSSARYDYFAGARWIERIELRNVRPIRQLDLDLTRSSAATAGWMVLLGDNGSGKSSILQAVALTLIGAEYRSRIGITPDQLLRRGARKGSVRVWLSNLPEPVTLEFARGASEFTGTAVPQVLLLAYGATRLRGGTGPQAVRSDVSHAENLFDARHELTNPNDWLLGLDAERFAQVTRSLHGLLALEPHNEIVRDAKRGQIYISYGKQRDPFSEMSDGYQSMLVLTCDAMRTMLSLWSSPEQAEGIVIIDEIGTHLHPRWRMRITAALRGVLPRVQFLVSTHDPLCLRGLEDGEITVINRNDSGDVVTLTDLPSVKGMRVDQLLTSEHFGLGSAQDPAVDVLYDEYFRLRGVAEPDAAQQARLTELEAELEKLRQLGVTQRERMMLTVADQIIAERRQKGDATVRPDLAQRMALLWQEAGDA